MIKPASLLTNSLRLLAENSWKALGTRGPPMITHPRYSVTWPERHRFAMWKFEDLKKQVVEEDLCSDAEFFVPQINTKEFDQAVHRAHDANYIDAFYSNNLDRANWRRLGFTQRPFHIPLVRRTQLEVAGTLLAADIARHFTGIAVNLAGGTHHAHRSYGAGFTALNDLAITALDVAHKDNAKVLIVDVDVHQGDGTAQICQNEPNVFTFSIHCADNYPFQFSLDYLGHDKSDLDIALPSNTDDATILSTLQHHLPSLLDTLALSSASPSLCLYDAGIDVDADDALGKFNCTPQGIFQRDVYVIEQCLLRAIPIVTVIGGGYDRDRKKLANRHAIVARAATYVWRKHFHTLFQTQFPRLHLLSSYTTASSISLPHLETPQGLTSLCLQIQQEEEEEERILASL